VKPFVPEIGLPAGLNSLMLLLPVFAAQKLPDGSIAT
jgi:hypothetical protein